MADESRIPEEELDAELEPDLGDEEEPEFELHGGGKGGSKGADAGVSDPIYGGEPS
jgi:hypothetical protein